ncbi:MAG TPA: acetyl-CoA hydrolase/transferase C-terminal domain-containing protein [Anaerolineaceae bacterium]|nr:acetyl-CoA hydrolase/transferase C-terminal domain-containing protein [Anaerolineaceae bacterium]HPN50124.1 acetyl-CoA hydrolase/transferase C-terminal domain-containing protein [Anaerolineaceae bacterium]
MNEWLKKYQDRIMTADEAVGLVKSGDKIFLTGNCSVPQKLLGALVKAAPGLQDVTIYQALAVAGSEYVAPEMEGHLRVNSLFISHNVRKAVQDGRADFTPVMLSEFPLLFKRRVLPLNVAFVHLSPPDEHGFCTYGIEAGLTRSAAESAPLIIAEINPQMPRILGDTFIHISKINAIVEVDYPLSELAMASEGNNDVIEKIAGYIAERIPDGATMQLGIGAIPDAVLKYLKNKKDLGVHSELFSDGVIELVQCGALTGARKTLHPGKIVAGFIIGTNKLYRWVNDNPMLELRPTEYVNSPYTIAQNARMVAINSALEVDLTGQICADSIGPKLYSGVGGQLDFIYGASLSDGGLPIIALPSTTTLRDGTLISRITPMLKQGAGVVTSRNHVHYVVTEYGMVDLYGKSIRQRTQLLISIAHPEFREELTKQARALNYL